MTRKQFVAKQTFERASFIYGQAVARRKRTREGSKERRAAASEEDICETRMTIAAAMLSLNIIET